jgi:hypothetical protein
LPGSGDCNNNTCGEQLFLVATNPVGGGVVSDASIQRVVTGIKKPFRCRSPNDQGVEKIRLPLLIQVKGALA